MEHPDTPPLDDAFACRERDRALDFLYSRIDYERSLNIPYGEREFKLDRMWALLARLGNPQSGLKVVHVAGTKGKGSASAMLAAVLTAAGYRTGLYSSPHLERLEERLAVDGQPCPGVELVKLVDELRPIVAGLDRQGAASWPHESGPTYFELTTAMALVHFARRRVDAAVLEVGLGGRLDSTNVCQPCVSVITSISFDHMKQLGDTLAQIAREKAGIIKPGVPVVSGVVDEAPREAIQEVCRRQGSRLIQAGRDFAFSYRPPRHLERGPGQGSLDYQGPRRRYDDLRMALLGRHQASNAATVLAVLEELEEQGLLLPEGAIRSGLAEVRWPARVEVVGRWPTIVVDAAHNVASVEALLATLDESFSACRRVLVFATTQEKQVAEMLALLLPRFDRVIFTRYQNNPRAFPPDELVRLAGGLTERPWSVCPDPASAWDEVHRTAGVDDLVCITGSFFIASEMRRQLEGRPLTPPPLAPLAPDSTKPLPRDVQHIPGC
ncbi:MAG: folylpolyglutamate synthase/dihydrofolate synthase family protein [Pirellulales bacterium]